MSVRLYYKDPYLKEFKSKILEKVKTDDKFAVVLERTCFYPTSGGQPNDLGYFQDVPVIDVIEEKERIVHLLKKDINKNCGDTIIGKIDWDRRFDHMQQHTGQHILSAAFERLWDADTVSFNLGNDICSIDIMKDNIVSEEIEKVEALANDIVLKNTPIEFYFIERNKSKQLNLRKRPPQEGKIRIVEIKDFDICACCGTHCSNTGEVGLIKILKWENRGAKIRIDFICGKRSLKDYFWKNELIRNTSNKLTVKDLELGEVIDRMLEERKDTRKKLRECKEKLQEYEVNQLISKSILNESGLKIIKKIFSQKSFQEVKELVQKCINMDDNIIVFAGIKDGTNGAKLLLACTKALKYDMNMLIKEAGKLIDGRGGGAPNFAQAGGKNIEGIEDALNYAFKYFEEFVK